MFCHPTAPSTWSVTLPKLDAPALVLQCLHATPLAHGEDYGGLESPS